MSSSRATVETVARKIAPYVEKSWPSDREDIYEILDFIQQEVWESGKFHGSSSWFYSKVYPDGTLKTPHGYNILLGIDINGKPKDIRDQAFLFHKNGPGDIMSYMKKGKLIEDVYDLGESPVLFQPTDIDECKCRHIDCEPKWLFARSVNCETSDPPPYTQVSGEGPDNNIIFTYATEEDGKDAVCLCTGEKDAEDGIDVVEGVRYPITNTNFTYKNIKFSRITNIVKEPTKTAVEYWAVGERGNGILVARLEPFQLLSCYKRYQIPKNCLNANRCVLGLFKRSKPDPILSDKQLFIISNNEAIVSLAIAMDYKFVKKDLNSAVPFIKSAAIHLNSEIRESASNSISPIQVDKFSGYANWPKF